MTKKSCTIYKLEEAKTITENDDLNNVITYPLNSSTIQYADEFEYLLKLLKEKDTYTVITHLKNVMEHYNLKHEDNIKW